MLLEFKCKNYRAIHDEIIFSMLAGPDDTREEDLIHFDKYRVNRISAIYGANGSGKSTVLDAMTCAKSILVRSMRREPGDKIPVIPHKLAAKDEPTEFSFQFVTNGNRYAYGFSATRNRICEEYLFSFPNKRSTKIFTREGMSVTAGDSIRKFSDASMDALKENRLFLACGVNYTQISELEEAYLFFKNELQEIRSTNDTQMALHSSIHFMNDHKELKPVYMKILNYLGTGITDFRPVYENRKIREEDLPDDMPSRLKDIFLNKDTETAEMSVSYPLFDVDLEKDESTGIKKLFTFLYPYLDTLMSGHILLCDEIETGLHESLVMGLLKLIPDLMPEKGAQIIFTTHDTSLLDSDLFRRDQIWFTEMNKMRSTDLYSLSEVKNVRKSENLKKGYVSGRYGAIPMLNDALLSELSAALKENPYESE